MRVEVAFAAEPKAVVGVNGNHAPKVVVSEDEDTLLLKRFQSVDESLPVFAPEATGRLKLMVLPVLVMVKSVPVVVVAKVRAPVSVAPGVVMDATPLLMLEVETHIGVPLFHARI